MAFFHSPNIVTDGLVLCLDAADKTSYSGSIHGGTIATWTDLSGNGNNGTFNNTTFDSGSGGNINFDGTDDYVQIGDGYGFYHTKNDLTTGARFSTSDFDFHRDLKKI